MGLSCMNICLPMGGNVSPMGKGECPMGLLYKNICGPMDIDMGPTGIGFIPWAYCT
jgi:hypothetical protein